MNNLTDEQLDRIAAEEVLGWRWCGPGDVFPARWIDDLAKQCTHFEESWHPTRDRNQSRLVVEAAMKKLPSEWYIDSELYAIVGNKDFPPVGWRIATPRQEVEAAILAVRSIEVSNG